MARVGGTLRHSDNEMKLTHKDRWEQGFTALCKFRRRKGHCCPPQRHVEGKYNLGSWVITQRYRKDVFTCKTQKTSRYDRFCLERTRLCLGTGLCSIVKLQAKRGTLLRPSFTPRRRLQTWIVGCGAAQKKECNVDKTEGAVKQNRLCVEYISAQITGLSARHRGGGKRRAELSIPLI